MFRVTLDTPVRSSDRSILNETLSGRDTNITAQVAYCSGVKRKIEHAKAQLHAKVENPFQVTKVLFNDRKARYHGLEKNTAQLFSLLGSATLMLAKRHLACAT